MELKPGRLKAIRERRLLTQQQLADLAGTTKTNVNRLESGRQKVRMSTLTRLAKVLDVAPDELVVFEDGNAASE